MKTIKTLSLLLALVTLTHAVTQATIRRVNNQGFGAAYTDLPTCIGAANPGDTIHVEASGVGYGIITLNIPLTIIGPGYFLNENPGLQKNSTPATINRITLNSGAAGTLITGIRIADDSYARIYINSSNIRIERCFIEDGFELQNSGTDVLNNISIKQCYTNSGLYHQSYPGPVNGLNITNSYFGNDVTISSSGTGYQNNCQGNITNCVFNNGVSCWSANVDFKYNIIKGGVFDNNNNSITNVNYNLFVTTTMPAWLAVPGNTNKIKSPVAAVFPNTTGSTDYKLHVNTIQQCPECYMTATNIETGVWGGADPYRLSGVPNVPAIYLLNAPSQSVQGGTINVNISTHTNN